jgi:hypothetical protein
MRKAAADLLAEENEHRLNRYLRLFGKRAFPLQIDRLLALVRHPSNDVMIAATYALSNVADPRVRALALEIIADDSLLDRRKSGGVDLLLSNYQPGDEVLLTRLLETPRGDYEYHSIGYRVLGLFDAHPTPSFAPALLAFYEHGPCTNCRRKVVKRLHQLAKLPNWMLAECQYDASLYLRETAAELAGAPPSASV